MIARLLTSALVIVSGTTLSQIPEFAQQYRQRIGGAVDELKTFVDRFDADAVSQSLTRDQALQRHLASADELFRKRGLAMQETIHRLDRLSGQQTRLTSESALVRLIGFAQHVDKDLAHRTLEAYEPAIPVTTEGGILAAIGAALGFAIARLLGAPKRMLDRRLAYRRQYEA